MSRPTTAQHARAGIAARFTTRRTRLLGTAIARAAFGLAALVVMLSAYTDRSLVWGPDRIAGAPPPAPASWSLYALGGTSLWFDVVFHAGILAAVAYTVVGGRVLAVVHTAFLWSLLFREPAALGPGEGYLVIATALTALAVTNAHLTPGSAARRSRLATVGSASPGVVVHNTAVALLVALTAAVYASAFLAHVGDDAWRSGRAVAHLASSSGLVGAADASAAATWFVLGAEAAFGPLVVLSRKLRLVGVAAVAAAHAILIVSGGLVTYAIAMAGGLAVCLVDGLAPGRAESPGVVPAGAPARRDPAAPAAPVGQAPSPATSEDIDKLLAEVDKAIASAESPQPPSRPPEPGPEATPPRGDEPPTGREDDGPPSPP